MNHYKNIVILDDDAESSQLFVNAVHEICYSAITSCYRNVDDFINQHEVTSDIIFLEINLKKTNGFKAVEMFKTTRWLKDVPLIIFSNSRDDRDIAELYVLGANRYFVKPVDYKSFEHVLRQIIMKNIDINDTNDFGSFLIKT